MPYKALCLQVTIRWQEVDSGTVTLWPNGWGLEGKVHKSSDIQNSDLAMIMTVNIYIYIPQPMSNLLTFGDYTYLVGKIQFKLFFQDPLAELQHKI